MKLTPLGIEALTFTGKQQTYFDQTVPGFGVRVGKRAKTFVLLVGRERKRHTIGRYPAISLRSARTAALRLLAEQDISKPVKVSVKALEAIDAFMGEKEAQLRGETLKIYNRSLRTHLKGIHAKNIEDVTTDDITNVTDKLLKAGKGASANQMLIQAKTFFRWAVNRRLIQHSPIENLDKPARQTSRERVLSDQELRTIWRAADETGYPFGDIIKLLILTGQRRTEIGSLKKEWCSLPSLKDGAQASTPAPLVVGGENTYCVVTVGSEVEDTWAVRPEATPIAATSRQCTIQIPSQYTKNKRSHTFPIGNLTTCLLQSYMPSSKSTSYSYLFPARGSNTSFKDWSHAKIKLDKKIQDNSTVDTRRDGTSQERLHTSGTSSGNVQMRNHNSPQRLLLEPWTLHDLRRTYATNLQRLGVKLEVIEALLNHVSGTRAGIVGVYQRHAYETEMREAVDLYEKWFTQTILSA